MTIRYTCIGCESVLKIKDEKAGSKGRCPKCKSEFMVPFASSDEEQDEETGIGNSTPPMDDLDMPLELTPQVEDHPDFDPQDVLNGPNTSTQASGLKPAFASDRKPSVAELMREFESGRKKDRRRESESEVGRPTVSSTPAQTVGTATNALSRAYQQKRESANAPVISAKDAKAAEQRALLMQFLLKKAVPITTFVGLLVGAYYWYMTQQFYSGIPLFPVNGKIISQSSEVGGLRVLFMPVVASGISDPRGSAEAVTAPDGSFELIYMEPHKGAPAGKYEVSVYGASGVPLRLSEGTPMLTVSDTEPNIFQIKL